VRARPQVQRIARELPAQGLGRVVRARGAPPAQRQRHGARARGGLPRPARAREAALQRRGRPPALHPRGLCAPPPRRAPRPSTPLPSPGAAQALTRPPPSRQMARLEDLPAGALLRGACAKTAPPSRPLQRERERLLASPSAPTPQPGGFTHAARRGGRRRAAARAAARAARAAQGPQARAARRAASGGPALRGAPRRPPSERLEAPRGWSKSFGTCAAAPWPRQRALAQSSL